jgi:peptidoglycan-associated lipoprotein
MGDSTAAGFVGAVERRAGRVLMTCFSDCAGRFARAAAVGCALLLAACSGGSVDQVLAPAPVATDAPAMAGLAMAPGSEEDFMVNVGRRVFFKAGSDELDQTAIVTLDKQAVWLNQYPSWRARVQGFADDSGPADAQVALSARRAEAVKAFLVSRGVAADRLRAKGYGRDRLVRDCPEIECKSQNRRVITNLDDDDLAS